MNDDEDSIMMHRINYNLMVMKMARMEEALFLLQNEIQGAPEELKKWLETRQWPGAVNFTHFMNEARRG